MLLGVKGAPSEPHPHKPSSPDIPPLNPKLETLDLRAIIWALNMVPYLL